jgi:hypothetical protein
MNRFSIRLNDFHHELIQNYQLVDNKQQECLSLKKKKKFIKIKKIYLKSNYFTVENQIIMSLLVIIQTNMLSLFAFIYLILDISTIGKFKILGLSTTQYMIYNEFIR